MADNKKRKRVLLAYEFGSGLGHLNRLVAIALELHLLGMEIVFAVPDTGMARQVIGKIFPQEVLVREGMVWIAPNDPGIRNVPTHTFADVLCLFGYDIEEKLATAATYWSLLVAEIQPDLVVADFAPTLRLVIGTKIPLVVVGNGYTIPPPGDYLPPIRSWETIVPKTSRDNEVAIVTAVNRIQFKTGGETIQYLSDLFCSESYFVCTIDMFDPYYAYRRKNNYLPFNVPLIKAGNQNLSNRRGPDIFVYFQHGHPALPSLIKAINTYEGSVQIYITGIEPRELAKHCGQNIGILTKPADLSVLLPQVKLLIHHAGLGTAYAGLAAGTPQLLLPLNLEHFITARGLVIGGVGHAVTHNGMRDFSAIGCAIKEIMSSEKYASKSSAIANSLIQIPRSETLNKVIETCCDLLKF